MCIVKAVGIVTRHTLNSYIHIRIEKDLGHPRCILDTQAHPIKLLGHQTLHKPLLSLIIVAKYVC